MIQNIVVLALILIAGCSNEQVEPLSIDVAQPSEITPEDLAPVPGKRGYGALVIHPPSNSAILFGGESEKRFSYEATWSYDLTDHQWNRLDAHNGPRGVGGIAVAYDSHSDKIIYYFGTRLDRESDRGLVRLSETWAFDVDSKTWEKMSPINEPFGMMGARMSYDIESDRVIFFGGADFTKEDAEWFNSTWAYDYDNDSWQEMNPKNPPPGRSYYGMTYDSDQDRVLVFSGSPAASAPYLSAYDYNLDSWQHIDYSGEVSPDHHPIMAYAPDLKKSFHIVGESFSAYDYPTSTWESIPRDSTIGVRHFQAMAYDESNNNMIIFGGGPRGMHYNNETWLFNTISQTWRMIDPPGANP